MAWKKGKIEFVIQTSHTKNERCTLKTLYFWRLNTFYATAAVYLNDIRRYFGNLFTKSFVNTSNCSSVMLNIFFILSSIASTMILMDSL